MRFLDLNYNRYFKISRRDGEGGEGFTFKIMFGRHDTPDKVFGQLFLKAAELHELFTSYRRHMQRIINLEKEIDAIQRVIEVRKKDDVYYDASMIDYITKTDEELNATIKAKKIVVKTDRGKIQQFKDDMKAGKFKETKFYFSDDRK